MRARVDDAGSLVSEHRVVALEREVHADGAGREGDDDDYDDREDERVLELNAPPRRNRKVNLVFSRRQRRPILAPEAAARK